MKNSVLFGVLASFFFGQAAQSAQFQVIGVEKSPIVNFFAPTQIQKESVGDITVRLLNIAVSHGILTYDGTAKGIVSINNPTNKIEKISNTRMKAYGWCYSVNGLAPDFMPDEIFLKKDTDTLRWFYAYSLYDNGKWVNQCVPVIRTSL